MIYIIPITTVILFILINLLSKKMSAIGKRPVFEKKVCACFTPKDYQVFVKTLTKKVPGRNYNLQTSTWMQALELAQDIKKDKPSLSKTQSIMFALKAVNPTFYSLALAHKFDISSIADEDYDDSPRIHEFSGYLDSLDAQFSRIKL